MRIEAVIFDVDGLLADTEPVWQDAELDVFGGLGMPLTREDCRTTMGLRVDEVVRHWRTRRGWTPDVADDVVVDRIVDRVCELVAVRDIALPGVDHAIATAADAGLRLAVASSSSMRIIGAILRRVGVDDRFEVVRSAEHEPYGKPHPGVFLSAAADLDVDPTACVVLEDSPNGILAAKAARMRCLAVPDPSIADHPWLALADVVLASLEDLDATLLVGESSSSP